MENPKKRYECSNCESILTIDNDKDHETYKCCEDPKHVLLSTEHTDEEYEKIENNIAEFRKCFDKIIKVLKKYIVLEEEYYPLIALWILGTYLHEEFNTFPVMFINASKGSGKTRLLKLIIALSNKGKMVTDLKESVLFRTAKGRTVGIDEFENVMNKELGTLRTMLNSCYKKGNAVERMKKVSIQGKEEWQVERFDLYTPLAMANIWGMEEVLSDRCLVIRLDKTDDPTKTKLIEDFETNPDILDIKRTLGLIWCSLCSVVTKKKIGVKWNHYVIDKYTPTLTTYTTLTTLTTLNEEIDQESLSLFNKIDESGLNGRNLELFFPLFILSNLIGKDVFEDSLLLAKKITDEKRNEEYTESTDVSLLDYISKKEGFSINFVSIMYLARDFKIYTSGDSEEEMKWLNSKWMGRALKRLKLVTSKRRVGKGIEVTLNVGKAKEKLKIFKKEVEK